MIEHLARFLGADADAISSQLLLRSGFAAFTGFLVTVMGTRVLLWALVKLGVSERVDKTDSEQLAELHKGKASTPTMGGIVMVAGILLATLLWASPANPYVGTGLLLLAGFAALGFLDDWVKLTQKGRKGLSIKGKLLGQILLAAGASVALYVLGRGPGDSVEVFVPVLRTGNLFLPAGLFFAFATLVMVATVNAVNFTDGLDGLASGCAVITTLPMAALAYLAGSPLLAGELGLPFVEGAGELAVFAGAVVGTGLGFLWHNCFPARLFMGDTGSLALGASLGYMAVAVKQELLLPLVGAVFVAEGLSVVLQILSFRLTGRRLFLIAPLHHRYQFLGWPETQITIRFWISSVVSAAAGTVALKL